MVKALTSFAVLGAIACGAAWAQGSDGRELFSRSDKGNCIACHEVPAQGAAQPQADVGPPLDSVRLKGWTRERLLAFLHDPLSTNPDTVMPPYGRHRILEPAELERVADYTLSLAARPRADAMTAAPPDAAQQGIATAAATEAIEAGRKIWVRKFKNGRSLSGCFPNGGRAIAAAYPQFDQRLKRVVTLEMAINQCLKTHGQPMLDPADAPTMGAALAYLRSLSDGRKIAVRATTPQAKDRLDDGQRLFHTRMGQQNYACASCHVQNAGRQFAGAALPGTSASYAQWPFLRQGRPETMHARIRACLDRMGAAFPAANSDEVANIEYYLAHLSHGVPLKPNSPRP